MRGIIRPEHTVTPGEKGIHLGTWKRQEDGCEGDHLRGYHHRPIGGHTELGASMSYREFCDVNSVARQLEEERFFFPHSATFVDPTNLRSAGFRPRPTPKNCRAGATRSPSCLVWNTGGAVQKGGEVEIA